MKNLRTNKILLALFAMMLIFGACKGESPTAPPPGGGGNPPGGGGNPPPTQTGIDVALSATSTTPLVDSSVTITATVTQNGQPVPIGTAVEFTTTRGTFDNTSATQVIKTTTAGGVVSVLLTSSAAGVARVTAIVNNVSRSIDITFQPRVVPPPPPNTEPSITSVSPAAGRPSGGETIRIIGANFRAPVRVFFNVGTGAPVEATVVSVTSTQIEVITPGVNLAPGQTLAADITVVTEAGTAAERTVVANDAFTYGSVQLTPTISTATPNSGPVTGGTMVTIFGSGFQAPVQVLFGAAEARVITVDFSKIVVEAPTGRDTSDTGSEPVTGQVPITVRNINSATSTTLTDGFRYVSAIQITAVGPTEGPFTGGTRVEIDGIGFVAPVAVTIGGVAAQPIFVSGTKIIAITSGISISSCADQPGAITVTNIVNGDSDTAETPFIFRVSRPTIISVTPSPVVGGNISIVVANAVGVPRLRLDDTNLSIANAVDNGNGTTTFTAVVPASLPLTPEACPGITGVSQRQPTTFDVVYTSATTTCTDTLANGTTVVPVPNAPVFALSPPTGFAPFRATITPGTPNDPTTPEDESTPPTVAPSAGQSVTLSNSGTGTINVQSVTYSAGCANFTVSNPPVPTTIGTCEAFTVSGVYRGTATPGTDQCVVTISTTNAGTRTLTLSGTSQ